MDSVIVLLFMDCVGDALCMGVRSYGVFSNNHNQTLGFNSCYPMRPGLGLIWRAASGETWHPSHAPFLLQCQQSALNFAITVDNHAASSFCTHMGGLHGRAHSVPGS
eukprot:4003661-Amphidinium_carterae.2